MSLINPLPSGRPTDGFGPRGYVPGIGNLGTHTGQDFAAPEGVPILAAHSGVVARVWWDAWPDGTGAGGNMIEIRGDDKTVTRYAHMRHPSPLKPGQRVSAGETVVGVVGRSGSANGDHLHFESLIQGQFVDPMPLIRPATPAVIESLLEDSMTNPIISVPDSQGTLYIGTDKGDFVQYKTPKAKNSRGILSKVFYGGPGGETDTIPALSWIDFEVAQTVWRQMCTGK